MRTRPPGGVGSPPPNPKAVDIAKQLALGLSAIRDGYQTATPAAVLGPDGAVPSWEILVGNYLKNDPSVGTAGLTDKEFRSLLTPGAAARLSNLPTLAQDQIRSLFNKTIGAVNGPEEQRQLIGLLEDPRSPIFKLTVAQLACLTPSWLLMPEPNRTNAIPSDKAALAQGTTAALQRAGAARLSPDDVGSIQPALDPARQKKALQSLKSVYGTNIDFRPPEDLVNRDPSAVASFRADMRVSLDGAARQGVRTIRLGFSMPPTDAHRFQLRTELEEIAAYNRDHPDRPMRVNLVVTPNSDQYGIGFAQIDEDQKLSPDQKRAYKCAAMLHRAQAEIDRTLQAPQSADTIQKLQDRRAKIVALESKILGESSPSVTDADVQTAVALANPGAGASDKRAAIAALQPNNTSYAALSEQLGADLEGVLTEDQPLIKGTVDGIELGNEPESSWIKQNLPKSDDDYAKETLSFQASIKAPPGVSIMPPAPEWDPASTGHRLDQIERDYLAANPGTTDTTALEGLLEKDIRGSSTVQEIAQYAAGYLRANPNASEIPVSIHLYNDPLSDRALIAALADVSRTVGRPLAISVTEFHDDRAANRQPDAITMAERIAAIGTNVMDEASAHPEIRIARMQSYSYQRTLDANPRVQFGLGGNPFLPRIWG